MRPMASHLNCRAWHCTKDAVERVDVQVRLGQQALELAVLQFEFAQPFGFTGVHAAVLGAPFVEGIGTNAHFGKCLELRCLLLCV